MSEVAQVSGAVLLDRRLEPTEYIAFEMERGQVLRVVDIRGQQVADIICFNRHNFNEKLSTHYTKRFLNRWRVGEGDPLISNECNDMFTIVRDTVQMHCLSGAFCSREVNIRRYGEPGERNCRDNLTAAVSPYGLGKYDLPGAFCTFMKLVYYEDGRCILLPPPSKAGDFIDLSAEMDLLVAISNCPQTLNPCNANEVKPLQITMYQPATS